jgi:hypothetical protein
MPVTINGGSGVNSPGLALTGSYSEGTVANGNSGTTKTLSLATGTYQTVTMTGNCTFTMPSVAPGISFMLMLYTGSGGFSATFTGVKWPGATIPTFTTTASRTDILSFVCDGTSWFGSVGQGFG